MHKTMTATPAYAGVLRPVVDFAEMWPRSITAAQSGARRGTVADASRAPGFGEPSEEPPRPLAAYRAHERSVACPLMLYRLLRQRGCAALAIRRSSVPRSHPARVFVLRLRQALGDDLVDCTTDWFKFEYTAIWR